MIAIVISVVEGNIELDKVQYTRVCITVFWFLWCWIMTRNETSVIRIDDFLFFADGDATCLRAFSSQEAFQLRLSSQALLNGTKDLAQSSTTLHIDLRIERNPTTRN
ncbi:hypothetical protein GPALN_014390 [Globodera pallida]|nr:hypothetical protein GPALN_014390 [Globodera pallida]